MVVIDQLQLNMRPETDDYSLYPEPPQGVFSSTPMDLGISPEGYGYPRPGPECFPTTMGYEGNVLYAEAPFMFNGRMSPNVYHDEAEIRIPSSNLSTASAPSAPSSAMGSPRSNHGQPAPVPEWAGPQGLGVSPGIVGQHEYFSTGTEYTPFPGSMEDFQQSFEFAHSKPGFVGELAQIPRSHQQHGSFSSSVSRDSSSTVVPEPNHVRRDLESSPVSLSPAMSPASSRKSSLVFVSPTSSSSFSSPPTPAWSSPTCGVDSMSPTLRPTPGLVSPFFGQSSGHFVAPLDSSYPSILHPDVQPMRIPYEATYPPPPAPYPGSPAMTNSPQLRNGSTSPFPNNNYHPYSPFAPPMDHQARRPSTYSYNSADQHFSDGESKEKQRCPHPDCGKTFKDLKAHMLTHQTERPEKCPIQTCDYHVKGFARKYDKNRHTLTHYKGTMVCGFCPGSGSAAEKSFNRADVFKRHLTAVHGVEQTPPNSRKKAAAGGANSGKKLTGYAPDATGKCSTCSQTFSNAQDFYEHLDDCVLRIVQQEDPAEAVNAQRLAEVENDREVHATLEKNQLPTTTQTTSMADDDEDEEMDDDDADEDFKGRVKTSASPKKSKGNPANGVQKSRGMTHSRGGVAVVAKNRGRKSRQNYPSSWGFDKGQMTMKKRVMTVFDGPRRLAKDDMMLSTEHEVRLKLSDGKSYVTDLDVQTMKRAEGFLNATDEEKGPWISDDPTDEELKQMQLHVAAAQ